MTFSIVARDPATGAFGVATATAGPMVGALVPHIRRGVGGVATQAMTNPYLAVDTLAGLDSQAVGAALRAALAADPQAELRQIIAVDDAGGAEGWTGAECIAYAGHLTGEAVAVAGNMLAGPAVLEDMLASFRRDREARGLASALVRALRAGAAAGGDSRGIGSAALRVHGSQAFADFDIRVDSSSDPMTALEHLFEEASSGAYAAFFATVPRR
ncbi:MAG TPA: DUF1028 domain-containing protein [Devosia sp.]|jgi:uncharacterized Ntn-hydrolase superfamily protein|nr:DUF1028 domain-containing protein [Devosia sp.]